MIWGGGKSFSTRLISFAVGIVLTLLRKKLQTMEHSGEAPFRKKTVNAQEMPSAGLDALLEKFAARPITLFTVISDDTRL